MKKLCLICLLVVILIANLCSWVDPVTVNTYDGVLVGGGSLSGASVSYYLTSRDIGISDLGYLINLGSSVIHGEIKIGSSEYSMRIFSGSEPEIYYNGSWQTYNIVPEVVPAVMPFPVYILIFIVAMVMVIVIFTICRSLI